MVGQDFFFPMYRGGKFWVDLNLEYPRRFYLSGDKGTHSHHSRRRCVLGNASVRLKRLVYYISKKLKQLKIIKLLEKDNIF
jgi:hypothetical protein